MEEEEEEEEEEEAERMWLAGAQSDGGVYKKGATGETVCRTQTPPILAPLQGRGGRQEGGVDKGPKWYRTVSMTVR